MTRVRWGLCVVLWGLFGVCHAQSLGGIFSGGSDALSANAAQIAALQALEELLQQGYATVEGGLDSIGRVHGAEFALHQAHFTSLSTVNPAVVGMPEISDILSREQAIVVGFGAAIGRWRASGGLTASEMSMAEGVYEKVCEMGAQELSELEEVLADGRLVMTDGEREGRVRRIDGNVREEFLFMKQFSRQVELLLANREVN